MEKVVVGKPRLGQRMHKNTISRVRGPIYIYIYINSVYIYIYIYIYTHYHYDSGPKRLSLFWSWGLRYTIVVHGPSSIPPGAQINQHVFGHPVRIPWDKGCCNKFLALGSGHASGIRTE